MLKEIGTDSQFADDPYTSTSTEFGRSRPNLVDFCNRMQERFFPELSRRS